MKITYKNLKDLTLYENNAKIHTDEQIELIAKSIKDFGFNVPILINDENIIISGHGRYKASELLELESVPTIQLSHLTEDQRKAFTLADNNILLSTGFDNNKLILQLSEIEEITMSEYDLLKLDELDDDFDLVKPNRKTKTITCPKCGNVWEE